MKKRLFIILAVFVMAAFLFTGCGSAYRTENSAADDGFYADMDMAAEEPAMDMPAAEPQSIKNEAYEEEYIEEQGYDDAGDAVGSDMDIDDTASILEPSADRKIIYSGYIQAQTKNFDADYDNIIDSLQKAGGYVENAHMYGTKPEDWQDPGRSAELTVRVPCSEFDTFMEMLKGMGDNISSSVSGRDISLEYFDTETRLETLRIREDRLQDLLEKATGLEDIIELERELANVSYEIQMYETNLRDFDSLIDFSTVTITLQEVNEITRVTSSDDSLGTRIKNGFYSVLNVLADVGEGLLIFLLAGSPIIIPLAIIAIIIVLLVRRSNRKHLKKQAELNAKNSHNNVK